MYCVDVVGIEYNKYHYIYMYCVDVVGIEYTKYHYIYMYCVTCIYVSKIYTNTNTKMHYSRPSEAVRPVRLWPDQIFGR